MLSVGIILFLLIWAIIFWINKITKKPTNQNQQGGDNQNTTTTTTTSGTGTTNSVNNSSETQTEKFSLWKFIKGPGIIILIIGFIIRMNIPYSETITVTKGQDYTFDVYNERIVINPQVHCVKVIYPDYAEYTFCPNVPINAGEHGVGLYHLQATSDSQFVIISKEPLSLWNKFKFWINPINFKFLLD